MPKTKKAAVKATKQKLSKEERSQIAKDRWAKIREAKAAHDAAPKIEVNWDGALAAVSAVPDAPIVEQELAAQAPEPIPAPVEQPVITVAPVVNLVPTPAPQLPPVKAPKQKRYTGPKEFSVALKAAESRLAKAIVERAQAAGQLAALQAEIPSLLGIINALKGSGNYVPPTPYDLSAGIPNAPFQAPMPPSNSLAAIQAAMAAPPVSRASGGAIQFSPEVIGALEGPDDDVDRYIAGPNAGGSGWIGG